MYVIAGMCTTKERYEFAKVAIQSLEPQVNSIHLWDNSWTDYTDNAKFKALEKIKEPCIFLSTDDDLIYPSDFVSKTLQAIEKHKGIVTYHGRILTGLNQNYYRDHIGFSCLRTVTKDRKIDVAGTGVTAFRTDYFNPTEIYKSPHKKMSDLVFSLEAAKQNKEITVINHIEGWLTDLCVPKDLTICYEQLDNPQLNELANEIYKLRHESNQTILKDTKGS